MILVCVTVLSLSTVAQIKVINNKGTFFQIDTSKWELVGVDIFNKNQIGNVGVGTFPYNARFVVDNGNSTLLPAFKLKYPFAGAISDSILTWNPADSTVRRINTTVLLNNSWKTTGNAGTTPATNFIGTTDNQRLVFRTNNTEWMTILESGNVGIGTSGPTTRFHVNGSVRLENVGSSSSNTLILTSNSSGVVATRSITSLLNAYAIRSLNGLTGSTQTFAIGTTGSNFNISSVGTVHTFNIPDASSDNRGALTNTDWITFNNKIGTVTATTPAAVTTVGTTATILNTNAYWNANQLQGNDISTTSPTNGQILTWNNTSFQWEPSDNTYQATIIEIYDAAGTQNLTTSFSDIQFGTTNLADAGYTIGGSGTQITISTAGTYKITYRITAEVVNNTSSGGEYQLLQNGSVVPGTMGYTYHHNNNRDKGTVTVVKLLTITANDVIKVQGRRYTSAGDITLSADGSSLIIERIK